MADEITNLFNQYQALRKVVADEQEAVEHSRTEAQRVTENLSKLEQTLNESKEVLRGTEKDLSEVISAQIKDQKTILSRAEEALAAGKTELAYLISTGQESRVTEEQIVTNEPIPILKARPQRAAPEIAVKPGRNCLFGMNKQGDIVWTYEFPYYPIYSPGETRIFVADYKSVVCLDQNNGTMIAPSLLLVEEYKRIEALLQDQDILFVATQDCVSAYDITGISLNKIWKGEIKDSFELVKSGQHLFAYGNGGLSALDSRTGITKWTILNSGSGNLPPMDVIAGGANEDEGVYIARNIFSGEIMKINPEGETLWTISRGRVYVHKIQAHNETLYVAAKSGEVTALDTKDGREKWRAKTDYEPVLQINPTEEKIELVKVNMDSSKYPKLIYLNPENGELI
ncbi:MAG TPA: PQQ-binding-like beta-propeller repeat protein [Candidatus Nanoarchaeia archaeon]|nr:PQQ-binding-like beta-propeller repeat protein [Candidatus Nanoarchaeia archaeon]